jgi:RNA polymerase sigma-70 factor (ECF subfamily)
MFAIRSIKDRIPSGDPVLVRVGRGDAGAMEECIETYGNMVWSIAKKYCRNHADAEDLTQDIFAELWRKASRYDSEKAGESTFIGMLARRRSIDSARKRGREPELEPISEEIEELLPTSSNSMKMIDHQLIMEAVDALPTDTKSLFQFHFESGMTHQEIATETGLPLGTIKTRLRKGLLELRKQFSRDQPGGGNQ